VASGFKFSDISLSSQELPEFFPELVEQVWLLKVT